MPRKKRSCSLRPLQLSLSAMSVHACARAHTLTQTHKTSTEDTPFANGDEAGCREGSPWVLYYGFIFNPGCPAALSNSHPSLSSAWPQAMWRVSDSPLRAYALPIEEASVSLLLVSYFCFLFLFFSIQFGLDSSFLRKYNFFKHLEIGSLLDGHFPVTGTTPDTLLGKARRMIDASFLLTVPLFICHLLFTSPVKFQLTLSCLKQNQGEGHMLSSS